jgi:hypothetical protein
MIITVDAGSRQQAGAMVFEAWKQGVEVEELNDNQIELISGREDKLTDLISRFPSARILHQELVKEI